MPYENHDPAMEELLSTWPNCASPDCPNKVCTWADDKFCYPCAERVHGKPYMREAFTKTHYGEVLNWSDEPGKL